MLDMIYQQKIGDPCEFKKLKLVYILLSYPIKIVTYFTPAIPLSMYRVSYQRMYFSQSFFFFF